MEAQTTSAPLAWSEARDLMGIPVYHITEIRNLPSILASGAIFCDAERRARSIQHVSIAHEHIKDRRNRRIVPVARGGTLSSYVPFYFAPRSPMLYTINKGNVTGYPAGQRGVAHLVAHVETLVELDHGHCFTDRHAELCYAQYFTDVARLPVVVDWKAMAETYWGNSTETKERRQAEFLLWNHVPWSVVAEVGVIDARAKEEVALALQAAGSDTPVVVHRSWYY